MTTIAAEQAVEDIARYLADSRSPNELLGRLGIIPELRKLRGIVPYCVNAARWRANQIMDARGTIAVDGESIMCIIAYASKSADKLTEKVATMLKKISGMKPNDHLIIAFDDQSNFRKKLLPEFKSDRKHDDTKNDIDVAKPDVIDGLRGMGFQVEVAREREADDILASVATQCQILGHECMIVSEDKDCWQALGPKTVVYSKRQDVYHGVSWLNATHKIAPAQVVDWLVLVGKNGVKGAEGIGPKTASNLLALYGDFYSILDNANEKQAEAMKAIDYWKLRSINTLDRRIPVGRLEYSTNDAN